MESPPTSAQLVISSSPDLPALEDIIAKAPRKPPLRSGSRAAAIPLDARTTFTSAAEVLREAPEIDIETERITRSPARKPKPTQRMRQKQPAQPRERPTLGRAGSLGSLSPDEKPWQRYRSRQSSNNGSPSPSKSQAAPAPLMETANKSEVKAGSETVSRHFATKAESPPIDLTSADPEPSAVPLPPAGPRTFARRREWTPPPPDSVVVLDSESDNREVLSSAVKPSEEETRHKAVFQTLQDEFGCKAESSGAARSNVTPLEVLGKRKLIETVPMTGHGQRTSRSTSPTKPATARRKVRTITELATAPYAAPIEPEFDITVGHTRESLLGYLDQGGDVKALFEVQEAALAKAKDGKKPSKAPPKKPRKKNGKVVEVPILLSPSTALKQSSKQDFVFGTSSQLIMDDSPRALRELQLAIQASNKLDDEANPADDQPGLWHAGARDIDGSLLEFRYVGSTSQDPVRQSPSPQVGTAAVAAQSDSAPAKTVTESDDLSNRLVDESTMAPVPEETPVESVAGLGTKPRTPRKAKKPNYELLTDVQLARKIKTFGFKPIKRRSAMISLLDQCWESQHQTASSPGGARAMTTSASPQSPKEATPIKAGKGDGAVKRPRGRPKKVIEELPSGGKAKVKSPARTTAKASRAKKPATSKPLAPIEISDSDDIFDEQLSAPSTPREASSPEAVFSPSAAPLEISTGDEADLSLALSPTDNEEILFKHITNVVKSMARSTDPAEPSWHEKMLLYDPIVLEDFAAWLNSGELTKVGWDAEVAPSDVKKWCESKSVICLWKQNTRGKERKRY
ncbi:uncharacterized protein B0I36DRAFT_316649 [Microdochium trichocladiopsis]|uniref:Structure-specific endonuclease subunit SLX4 n=1 Tax=Microdochium trichocladiopsis TaxID=1682393 RepID=A0A9P9BW17_9PEZI|nr:uncharacterized protein B0I36DRAFT_316649 [Microdochium trichocladiopsis]KAH7034621.1 hypothetical protein B0I36DRAFT_316649 [Microdochium trichocladiopsis]